MTYKEEFIKFIIDCKALLFGEFTLKSGRVAPYFINTGKFNDGEKIKRLGEYYAEAITEHFSDNFDVIFGPSYKGIPLCLSTSIALSNKGVNKGYAFNRKKLKDYALKDNMIGAELSGKSVIIVDDVITSGKAIRESLDILKEYGNPVVKGVVISVDRQEKGLTDKNALKALSEEIGVPIYSIVNFNEIMNMVENPDLDIGIKIDEELMENIKSYRKEYGSE